MRYALGLIAAIFLIGGCGEQAVPAQVLKVEPNATPPKGAVRPAQVELISLQVTKLPRDQFGNGVKPGTGETVAFWLAKSGTVVDLRVKLDRPVARFDEAASRLLRFADDKGGNLTRQPEGKKIDPFFEDNKPIRLKLDPKSDAGEVLLLGYGTPTPGATRLLIDADLVFLVGSGERTAERKGVEPKPGTKVEVGPLRMTFKDPKGGGFPLGTTPGGGNDRDEMPLWLTYEGSDKLLKAVEWLDPDGKVATTTTGDWFGASRGGAVSLGIPKMSRVGIRVVYYEKSEAITVPLRLDTGVGF
jgi:hypothetical protein